MGRGPRKGIEKIHSALPKSLPGATERSEGVEWACAQRSGAQENISNDIPEFGRIEAEALFDFYQSFGFDGCNASSRKFELAVSEYNIVLIVFQLR